MPNPIAVPFPERITVPIKRWPHAADLELPSYATEGSAGMDLRAAIDADVVLQPGAYQLISTGISIAPPVGYEVRVHARSGLAAKHGVGVVNGVGVGDSDFRGEYKIILINWGAEPFTVTRGMRIAQIVISRYAYVGWQEVAELDDTSRGAGGFGSTGTR
jgi:dUTP pyrophosphatase